MGNTILSKNEHLIFFLVEPFKNEVNIPVLLEESLVNFRAVSYIPGSSKNDFKLLFNDNK